LNSDIDTLREKYGYNEFSVETPEPLFIKFAKTIYESPLILLLCGSAIISAIMGNVDDALSITVAVLIVLTGMPGHPESVILMSDSFRSWICARTPIRAELGSSEQTRTPSLSCSAVCGFSFSDPKLPNIPQSRGNDARFGK